MKIINQVDCYECKENLCDDDNLYNGDCENYPFNYLNYSGHVYYLCNGCYENYHKKEG